MRWFTPLIVLSHVKQCSGKTVTVQQESEPAKPPVNLEEIRAELKAKIEAEAYNKGWGLTLPLPQHTRSLLS